jgi:adenine-specific DNA methylase
MPFSVPTFIETQFPIARLSAESYKERKAGASQTLTGLGKWWGRKPLILVRASILGMLMPASGDPKRDREIFLKILTMDDEGAIARWRTDKRFSVAELGVMATRAEQTEWNELDGAWEAARQGVKRLREASKTIAKGDKAAKEQAGAAIDAAVHQADCCGEALQTFVGELQIRCFHRLSYTERITRCERPENIEGPTPEAWTEINAHLGTTATSLPELVEQLGQRTFGHTPRVGDAFCGGGSIPFEAARIGCEAFGSDLNPVAGLLTWGSLNLIGGGDEVHEEIRRVQEAVFAAADRQITEWGIEHNERGERAEAYVYCVEVKPDGCDYYIPLAPSWLVDEFCKVAVRWDRTVGADHLTPQILLVPQGEIAAWAGDSKKKILPKGATVSDSRAIDPFDASRSWSVEALRGSKGLRRWSNDDVVPRPGDVFQERLYCIRWVKTDTDPGGTVREIRRYDAPGEADLRREARVLELLRERFADWQRQGFIPSKSIPESGAETDRLFRERGWSHWHHLFTPRQLLTHGLLASFSSSAQDRRLSVVTMLNMGRLADWDCRLCCWLSHKTQMARGKNTFLNQALNTLFNYSNRPLLALAHAQISLANQSFDCTRGEVKASDARDLRETCDFWITDPPYADAVNYHELGDFFLAWYEKQLAKAFPEWTRDARAELAVRGDGEDFRRSMVEIYKNLARHMPDNGMQMVMFTHQDPAVWADLGMILWAAGLKATAAWTISTETEAVGIKKGNYVQGTVCLVLRKRTANAPGFLDEVYPLVEDEVKRQIASMQAIDEGGEPNFNDADYQLAAYAAALTVLTQYGNLDGKDVEHEVFAVRERSQKSDFQNVIERALGIACDVLIPQGLDTVWRDLSLVERYYLRALDIESRGERRNGMYEELARGFGVTDIKPLLKSDKANGARMHTPTALAAGLLAPIGGAEANAVALPTRRGRIGSGMAHPFAASPLRHLMFAIRETTAVDNSPEPGRQYLRDTFGQGYWGQRERFIALLEWLASLGNAVGMGEWITDSEAARILGGRLRNDQA